MSPNLKAVRERLIESAKERDEKGQVGVLWAVAYHATDRRMDPLIDWDQMCVEQLSNLLERKRPGGNNRQRLGVRPEGRNDHDWIERGLPAAVDLLLVGARPRGVADALNKLVAGPHSESMSWLLLTMIQGARGASAIDLGASFNAFMRSVPDFEGILLDDEPQA